ncbi:acyl-CoA-binding protein-like isoform X3 [Haliotis asinina]|uniref:acyl-CoA-binding protein-like isoform X3 n=1 Tax=Haliotis asinina TaxID=109174 RepID=UPI003531B453
MADEATFYMAAEEVKELKSIPTNAELVEIYALYKQATDGDCNIPKPGSSDIAAKAKWGGWNEKRGMSAVEARTLYVAAVEELKGKYGI